MTPLAFLTFGLSFSVLTVRWNLLRAGPSATRAVSEVLELHTPLQVPEATFNVPPEPPDSSNTSVRGAYRVLSIRTRWCRNEYPCVVFLPSCPGNCQAPAAVDRPMY